MPDPIPTPPATPDAPVTPAAVPPAATPVDPGAPPSPGSTPAPPVTPPTTPPATPTPTTPPATPEPVAYALTLPKDSPLTSATVDRMTAHAKALGLSPEHAQKTLEAAHQEAVQYWADQEAKAENLRKVEWVEQTKADKELGGEHYQQTLMNVSAARQWGVNGGIMSADFDKFVFESGLGNHPEMIRFMNGVGRMVRGEIGLHVGTPPAPPRKTMAERMYPNEPTSKNG